MAYGDHTDVAARHPRGAPNAFSASSKPTDAQVTTWLDEVSAWIDGRIKAAGYDAATVSAGGLLILRKAVTEYVAGLVERYWGGEDAETGEDAGDRKRPLRDLIHDLRERPADVAVELGLSPLANAGSGSSLASFHTDSPDRDDLAIVPDRQFKVGGKF